MRLNTYRLGSILTLGFVLFGISLIPRAKGDEKEKLFLVLDRRMVVWKKPSGESIYIWHCRSAEGGCRRRLEAFATALSEASEQYGLDPWLLAAVAIRESGMNPDAVGSVGERGIVQLNPRSKYARDLRYFRSERYRSWCMRQVGNCQADVIDRGAKLLSRAIKRCGTVRSGLGMYQTGRCDADRLYVRRVLHEYLRLTRLRDQI